MAELNCLYGFLSQKEKNLLLQQAVELILRMVAKLGILGLVSRSLGEKAFVFKRHEKTATNTLNVIWKQNLIVSWDLKLWPAVSGPHVLLAVGHTTRIWPAQVHTEWCWCQACFVVCGSMPDLVRRSIASPCLAGRYRWKLQTSTHVRLLTIHKSGLVSCSVFAGLLQLLCAARSHGW